MLLNELNEQGYIDNEVFKDKTNPINNSMQWGQVVKLLNKLFWSWYEDQKYDMERPIITLKKFKFISFTIRVKHLETILTWIIGAPSDSATA